MQWFLLLKDINIYVITSFYDYISVYHVIIWFCIVWSCGCVCVVCVFLCIYVCLHTWDVWNMFICAYVNIWICNAWLCIWYVHIHVCSFVYGSSYVCVIVCVFICIHTHVCLWIGDVCHCVSSCVCLCTSFQFYVPAWFKSWRSFVMSTSQHLILQLCF